jgi:pectate lyase
LDCADGSYVPETVFFYGMPLLKLLSPFAVLVALAALPQPDLAAEITKPDFGLCGFADVPGYGIRTTVGGGNEKPIVVRSAKELQRAVERLDIEDKKQRENSPRVVLVSGDIDLSELSNQKVGSKIKAVGVVKVPSDTTLYAVGAGATLRHGTLEVQGAHNVILRNLSFRDLWEEDPIGAYDALGWDYVRITNAGEATSHHIWVNHCDFGKVYDGMLDITHGSDLVTVSWCRFAGDERGAQKKASLIGHSSSASAAARDKGRLNVTFHHNWFENIEDRAPRARFGNIHAFNNFVDGAENATLSVMGAVTLVENGLYRDVRIATSFSHDKDSVSQGKGGTLCIVGSRNEAPRLSKPSSRADKQFEIEHNFQSSVPREQLHFNAPLNFRWEDRSKLPYPYRADAVEQVPSLVVKYAGTGQMD